MAAHQAGFANVVASLGTALTHGQVELATRYADAVALAYDVDLAGEAATQRGLLEELGPDQAVSKVRVVRIPAGKDPGRAHPDRSGRVAHRGRRGAAGARLLHGPCRRIGRPVERDRAARGDASGAGRAAPRGDRLEQTLYLQRLSRLVDVDEKVLADELAATPRPALRQPANEAGDQRERVSATLPPLEAEALRVLLRYPATGDDLGDGPLPFREAAAAALARAWASRAGGSNDAAAIETFVGGLDAATAELARDLLADVRADTSPRLEPDAARDALRSCLRRLRVQRIEDAIRDGRLLMDEADREGDAARVRTLEEQMTHLGREKAELTRAMREPATAGARRS